MADDIEHANDMQDIIVAAAINNRVVYSDVSAEWCDKCGEEIPEGRRKALPGIKICVFCADKAARLANGRR